MKSFTVGDFVMCRENGIRGVVIGFYYPTASEEQTMVRTEDGRKYHAPTRMWVLTDIGDLKTRELNILYPENPGQIQEHIELRNSIIKLF